MRAKWIVVVAVVAVAAAPGIATAQDGLEQCFGKVISQREAQMRCVKGPGGEWMPAGGGESGIPGVGAFFALAILLALIPAFAGMTLAPDADVSPAAGFGIGLFASWVGVIGLYLYGHSQRRTSSMITTGAGGHDVTSKPPEPAADRLRNLQKLLDEGLITQEEYQARRAATIETL